MLNEKELYKKYLTKEPMTDEECEWLTYYESLKSRNDSDHEPDSDPLVGALIRDENNVVKELSHRASGQEGDHAEFTLLKGRLIGQCLDRCSLFTTLEPCVDDVRSGEGNSCSSLICKSEIKDVHIGILDPNNNVYGRGIETLFNKGITVHPYKNKEVIELVRNSCKAFIEPNQDDIKAVVRFKKDVMPKIDTNAIEVYLRDLFMVHEGTLEGFDFDAQLTILILMLLKQGYVSMKGKEILINESIKVMFFKKEHLPHNLTREIKIIRNVKGGYDPKPISITSPLPIAYHDLESLCDSDETLKKLDKESLREILANLIIHRSYDSQAALGYIEFNEEDVFFKNQASKIISKDALLDLQSFKAESVPGNGAIAKLFNEAQYCERSKRGQRTLEKFKDQISIKIKSNNIVEVRYKLF